MLPEVPWMHASVTSESIKKELPPKRWDRKGLWDTWYWHSRCKFNLRQLRQYLAGTIETLNARYWTVPARPSELFASASYTRYGKDTKRYVKLNQACFILEAFRAFHRVPKEGNPRSAMTRQPPKAKYHINKKIYPPYLVRTHTQLTW